MDNQNDFCLHFVGVQEPLAAKQYHENMMLPPSCFTVVTELLGLEASPLPLQAYLLSLWPSSDHKSLRKWTEEGA